MPKSKYPNKLDTSVELPVVRDNITDLTSETINALRDAIIKIERTLGINPQGAAGNNVSTRLSKSLDSNGNIKKEALASANVLSGPIIDTDVSKVAGIKETKLKLDYPTRLLQSEISILGSQIDTLLEQLERLNAELSVHIHPAAKNRHKAIAITMDSAFSVANDTATTELEIGTLQEALETIYSSHINYSGANIGVTNSSHRAEQIYFNNEDVSDVLNEDDVQGAIVELADLQSAAIRKSALNLSSNGRIRSGSSYDGFAGNLEGKTLISNASVSYSRNQSSSRTTFTFSSSVKPEEAISEFDLLTVQNSAIDDNNKSYQISSVTLSGDSVTAIEVYGGPVGVSETGITIRVTKPVYGSYNRNGLNSSVRPRNSRTNTPDVIVANPDSATVLTSGILPGNILSDTSSFNIIVDSGSAVTIETYDATKSVQNLDTIVNKINEQFVDLHISAMAYKVKVGSCYELAISHMVPNFAGDVIARTIKISEGSTNDGTTVLGFADILDKEYQGTTDNNVHLNGYILSGFGKVLTFDDSLVQIIAGSRQISLFSGTFESYGVRVGDTVCITNSTNEEDNGSYRIKEVNEGSITLDYDDATINGSMGNDSLIVIMRNAAVVDELTFTESISIQGSIMFDVFMDESKDINYKKRMEIDGNLTSSGITVAVVDVSKNFIVSGDTGSVTVGTDGYAYLTGPDSQTGPTLYVGATGQYKLLSYDQLQFVVLDVVASGNPTTEISVDLYGFDEIPSHNYRISRGLYGTSLGRVLGESSNSGVPSVRDKRTSGTVDETIVGESLLEKYIEGPRNELRGSGIIRGFSVSNIVDNSDSFTFDVSAGVALVNGIRYEYPGSSDIRVPFENSFYVAIDEKGCVIAGEEIENPGGSNTLAGLENVSPFHERNVAHLAYIDSSDNSFTDLRFFIDHLDYKLSNTIIVSEDIESGHFTSIGDAVAYLRLITGINNLSNTPKLFIGPGDFSVSSQINIDFDLIVEGSGPTTVIRKTSGSSLASGRAPDGTEIFMTKALFLVGDTTELGTSRIQKGVTFRDFTYISEGLTNVGIVIGISQDLVTSPNAVFRVENINFIGPTNMNGSVTDSAKKGEYAVYVGQQTASSASPKSSITMGNLIFSNNYLKNMGLGNGAIYFTESTSSSMYDVVVTGNIGVDLSPNVGNTSVTILQIPSVPTVSRFVESGNTVSD